MNQEFVARFMAKREEIRTEFAAAKYVDYFDIVRTVAEVVGLDPTRVVEIDHGDYQGTLVYVIGKQGYQPSEYWYVQLYYGSCSLCDTLQGNDGDPDGLVTLALHVVQKLTKMETFSPLDQWRDE